MTPTADSWIDGAPVKWTRGRIKNLIASSTNGTWGGEPAEDGSDVRCIRAADFDRVGRRTKVDGAPLRNIDASSLRQHLLRPGDLILEKSGGGEKQPVGMAVLYEGMERAVCSNFCSRISPAVDVDSRFLAYVFAAAYGQGLTQSAIKQTTGIQNLDAGVFFSSPWAYPGLDEQRRIADFLDAETARLDALATAMNSQDAALQQRRLRVLDFASEHAPKAPLVRLGYLSSLVTSGSRGWGDFVSDTGSLFFRSANLYPDRVQPKLTNLVYVQVPAAAASEAQRSRIEPGDVLVGITGANAGWVCLANDEVAGGHVSQHVCLVRPDKNRINVDWLAFLIASPATQSKLMGNQYGGTKTQLSLPDIREIRIPVLPVEQQAQITHSIKRQIDAIDRQRLLRQRQLVLLAERRQSLITAAVTGQFDVTTASGRNVTDGVTA
ncbi:restriction endonuclease subunit S [Streptomyces sp. NPDC052610]|uniref:restriction endonuclease subunit S n=1 Tax=Streptomyces sp. NPDC052610 TaxID=3154952 RepID=UPI0034329BC8